MTEGNDPQVEDPSSLQSGKGVCREGSKCLPMKSVHRSLGPRRSQEGMRSFLRSRSPRAPCLLPTDTTNGHGGPPVLPAAVQQACAHKTTTLRVPANTSVSNRGIASAVPQIRLIARESLYPNRIFLGVLMHKRRCVVAQDGKVP